MVKKVATGYDGSESSRVALEWAAGYAAAANVPLRIIHASMWPMFTKDLGPVDGVADSGLRHSAEAVLTEGVDLVRGFSAELDIESRMGDGLPGEVLIRESLDADLLVVGNRGLGRFLGKMVGSVSLELAGLSLCPLVVVRSGLRESGPVVACVEGRSRSSKVLEDAVRMARTLQRDLRIVHVAPTNAPQGHLGSALDRGPDILHKAALSVRALDAGMTVTEELLQGHPVSKALLDAADEAELLVLGAHGRRERGRTLTRVLQKAPCNVMISR